MKVCKQRFSKIVFKLTTNNFYLKIQFNILDNNLKTVNTMFTTNSGYSVNLGHKMYLLINHLIMTIKPRTIDVHRQIWF